MNLLVLQLKLEAIQKSPAMSGTTFAIYPMQLKQEAIQKSPDRTGGNTKTPVKA